jgi:uncharacterized protein (TIGR04255 family)
MPVREVYPNATLRLVTAEFRFPISPRLGAGTDPLSVLSDLFSERLPIIEPASMSLEFSSAVPQPQFVPSSEGGYRFLARDRMTALTIQAGRVAVEVTAYEHWAVFRELIRWALEGVGVHLNAIASLDRVGLRYIDEIRVPTEPSAPPSWAPYIDEHLLAPLDVAGDLDIKTMQGALQLATGEGSELVMRYGTLTGHIVADVGPLHLPTPAGSGPMFFIDTDSYWTPPHGSRQEEFDLENTLAIADRVHAPVSDLFERAITDRLRNDVLRSTP